jgi:hypothetical protein
MTGALTFLSLVSAIVWLSAILTWRRRVASYATAALFVNLLLLAALLSPLIAMAFAVAGATFAFLRWCRAAARFKPTLHFGEKRRNAPMPPVHDAHPGTAYAARWHRSRTRP